MRLRIGALLILVAVAFAMTGYARSQSAPSPQTPPPQTPATQGSAAAATTPKRIRLAGSVEAAKLIAKAQPTYPPKAVAAGVHGNVILHAIIGTNGSVKTLQVISGDPLLIQAAQDAVRQWKYAPTLLNGEPVEVDTTVTVTFTLSGANAPQQQAPPVAQTPPAATPSAATPAAAGAPTANMPPAPVPQGQPAPIDPQLKADLLHLFQVMKLKELIAASMRETLDQMRPQLIQSLPATPNRDKIVDEYLNKLVEIGQSDDVINGRVAIYAKYLSDADVKALIVFYQTPAGQHYDAAESKIFAQSTDFDQQNIAQHKPQIVTGLCTDFPELQGQVRFCPKVDLGPGGQGQSSPPPAGGVQAPTAPSTPVAPAPPTTPGTPAAPTTPPARATPPGGGQR